MTKEYKIDLSGISVCIGIPSTRNIHPLVVKSLFSTQELCFKYGIPCYLAVVSGNAIIQWARDEVIDLMLESKANRFFLIDDDIIWEAEDFMRLLSLSKFKDVICASYPAKREPKTFYIRYNTSEPLVMDKYGLVEIQGAGLGFTVIKRDVIEKIKDSSVKIRDEIADKEYASIFNVGVFEGKRRGEDMSFFESLTDIGVKIHLDPSVELGHIGTKIYRGKAMDALTSIKE